MTREPSGCSLCLREGRGLELRAPEDSKEPDAPQASAPTRGDRRPLTPVQGTSEGLPASGGGPCTHLSEERGCPSFCHLVGRSMEATSGQKSRTACPRAACTREGSAPATLTLGRWAVRTCPTGSKPRPGPLRQCVPSCQGHLRGQTPETHGLRNLPSQPPPKPQHGPSAWPDTAGAHKAQARRGWGAARATFT